MLWLLRCGELLFTLHFQYDHRAADSLGGAPGGDCPAENQPHIFFELGIGGERDGIKNDSSLLGAEKAAASDQNSLP